MLGLLAMVLLSSVMSETSTDPSESVEQTDLNYSKDGGSNGGGDSDGYDGHDKGGGVYNSGGGGNHGGGDDEDKTPNKS